MNKPFHKFPIYWAKRRKYNPMRLFLGEYFLTSKAERAVDDIGLDVSDIIFTKTRMNKPNNSSSMEERKLAELFHDTYETLAPAYGYETREDTRQFDPESKNGKLMIAVCKHILANYFSQEKSLLLEEVVDEGWKYIVRATDEESWSKEDFRQALLNNKEEK